MLPALEPLHPPGILIVEDNFLAADALADAVRTLGYEVARTTPSVTGGLRALAEQPIDCAILDIDLGGRPSFPLCTALKARHIPFLFVSGYSPGTFVPAEFEAAPHLAKPVDGNRLERALRAILPPPSPPFGNCVLDSLAAGERLVIQDALEKVVLKERDVLEEPGQPTAHVYFPIDALVSIRAGVERGTGIEVASVGHDGMTAPGLLLGDPIALGQAVVQSGGRAWRLPAPAARTLADRYPFLRERFLRQVARSLSEIVDTSMFNGRATIVERLARWLLYAASRLQANRLVFTHDALAGTLGVRRPSVTVGLQILEGDRLIRSTRRAIVLLDLPGLARVARLDDGPIHG